jgi:DNA-directed RNA polymerase beta' subunit
MKKYILSENTKVANELIQTEKTKIAAAQKFLSLIKPLGFDGFTSWSEIEDTLKQVYPKATLLFNIQAQGIEQEYNEAKEHYSRFGSSYRFEPLTDQEQQEITENVKVYTTSEAQNEVYEIVHRVVADLNKLKELGLDLNVNGIHEMHRLFAGHNRDKPAVRVNTRDLADYISRI